MLREYSDTFSTTLYDPNTYILPSYITTYPAATPPKQEKPVIYDGFCLAGNVRLTGAPPQ